MRAERGLLRAGEYLLGRACRQLPHDIREERYREWAAELPAILHDRQIGSEPRRAVRMLGYAADTLRGAALVRVRARRPLPHMMIVALCLLLVTGLAVVAWDIRAVAGAPGDPLDYLRLAWGALLVAYPVSMLIRTVSRVSTLIVSGAALVGVAVNLWDVTRVPADWANYFQAALLFLLFLGLWIVSRRARAGQP